MRVYISHPIAGRTEEEIRELENVAEGFANGRWGHHAQLTFPRKIEPWCSNLGIKHKPCPPGRQLHGDDHTIPCYLRGDLAELLKCDEMVVAPGWQSSYGCMTEINLASAAGIPIHFA